MKITKNTKITAASDKLVRDLTTKLTKYFNNDWRRMVNQYADNYVQYKKDGDKELARDAKKKLDAIIETLVPQTSLDELSKMLEGKYKIKANTSVKAASDWYFGKEEADQYGDLIVKKLAGKTVSKRRDTAEEPGGLIFEADRIGIDMWDLLRALEGLCYQGRAREIDDSTYKVFADVEGTKDIVCEHDPYKYKHLPDHELHVDEKVEYLLREAAKMLGYRIQEWTTKNDPYGPTETAYLLVDENGDTVGMLQETYETDVLGILHDCFNNIQRAKKKVAEYLQNETQRFDDAFNSPTL